MRFKDAPKQGKQFGSDLQESSLLHGQLEEQEHRAHLEKCKSLPDAKAPPRHQPGERGGLEAYGLGCLSDFIASCDLLEMRNVARDPQITNNVSLVAELMLQLHEVPREPDIQTSFQWLGQKTTFDDADGGVWQVQMGRRRRRRCQQQQQERMSRDHHDDDADDETETEHADTHGNVIELPIEATRRVATTKETKRLRKAIARRRRAGEADVFTDDELDKANLVLPPPATTKPRAPTTNWPPRATIRASGSTKGAALSRLSSSSMASSVDSSWDLMYLEPQSGVDPVASIDSSEQWFSDDSWMMSGGTIVARVSSGSWS